MIRKLLANTLRGRTYVLLLALLISCASTLTSTHVHAAEKDKPPGAVELAQDCALCHAYHDSAVVPDLPASQATLLHVSTNWGTASSVHLAYSYKPESRAPPVIS